MNRTILKQKRKLRMVQIDLALVVLKKEHTYISTHFSICLLILTKFLNFYKKFFAMRFLVFLNMYIL